MNGTLRLTFTALTMAALSSVVHAGNIYGRLLEIESEPNGVNILPTGEIIFTLVEGDQLDNGSSRAMLREQLPTTISSDQWAQYQFGIIVPDGWPADENKDVLVAQWRNGAGSPYTSIHLQGSEFYIKMNDAEVTKDYFPYLKNQINHFDIRALWSSEATGRMTISVNGTTIEKYGQNILPEEGDPHFSFGIYRPQWNNALPDLSEKLVLIFPYVNFGQISE